MVYLRSAVGESRGRMGRLFGGEEMVSKVKYRGRVGKKRLIERAHKLCKAYGPKDTLTSGELDALLLAIQVMRYFGLPDKVDNETEK